VKGYGYISNAEVSISLSNREGTDETGKRIARIKPFGKGEEIQKSFFSLCHRNWQSKKVSL